MIVDVWTDIVCPWCYIGITRFDRALERFSGNVEVRLHPFQLDPGAPVPGIPALERYALKFGDEAPEILQRVRGEAAKEGIEMNFERAITANTFDAHRLLRLATRYGRERDLEMSLYRAYFTEGLDISDRTVLADRASDAGMTRDEVLEYLSGGDGVEEVRDDLASANARGISAVPAFVFESRYLVPGAVDSDTFVRILEEVSAINV